MKLSKNLWALFFALMCIVNVVIYAQYYVVEKTDKVVIGENLISLTGEINAGNSVTADFTGNGYELVAFDIFFSTYNRVNAGMLTCTITEKGNTIFSHDINMAELEDNSFYRVECPGLLLKEHQEYRLSLSSDITGESITAWQDDQGNLVSNLYTAKSLSAVGLLAVNLVYALINYLMCLMVYLLRRK